MNDRLQALEDRGDELEAFAHCERTARTWLKVHSTDELVAELRAARAGRRRVHVGTSNTLILLDHIDRLEAELAKEPVRFP